MNLSMRWLKDYVDIGNVSMRDFSEAMSMSGSKVEGWETEFEGVKNVVVGKILSVEPHPDSDHLVICQLDVAQGEPVQIVTGASNVHAGDLVPVALHKSKLPNGVEITKGKLRGVMSNGMMCSLGELNLTKGDFPYAIENGIFLIEEDCKPGQDIASAIGCNDTCVEFEITPNRPDCLSVIGLAREVAVTFDKPINLHAPVVKGCGGNINDYLSVEVQNKELCQRYVARVVKNVKIGPSPRWMRERLRASGVRPIDNIVDITNYVMEEYGQPMHAYDLNKIRGHKIVVKRANDGDVYTTLDGQERKLDKDVLMINDAEGPVGIAGIMGGENSMVTDDIQTMLFEAATFDGTNIRLSSKRIGLRTDASGKFEKGLDPENALEAINRACQLVEELGAGEVVGGVVDVYPNPVEDVKIPFEPAKYNKLLGTNVSEEKMMEYFDRLEIGYDKGTNMLLIPSFRQDLRCSADIAEEVARFFGYDNIPTTLPHGEATAGKKSFAARVEDVVMNIAEQNGFCGGMCYSFESPKVFDKLLLADNDPLRQAIVIANPLGEDYSIMRTIELNGILTSLAGNYNHRNKNVRLYEIGNVYLPKALPLTELPDERKRLTLGMYGECDFFMLKGVLEEMFLKLGLDSKVDFEPSQEKPFLHPGRQALIYVGGAYAGFIGQVHPEVCENYDMKCEAYVAGIDLPTVTEKATFDRRYEGVAKYPAVNRDLSLVMKKDVFVGSLEKVMKEKGGKLLESIQLFDVYEGSQIEEGYKSVAFSLVFRSPERSLEAAEINKIVDKILKELEKMGVELRA